MRRWLSRYSRPVIEPGTAERSAAWSRLAGAAAGWEATRADAEALLARADRVLDHRYRFLNQERRLPAIDWSATYETALWTYHLHYFDHGLDLARAFRATGDRRYVDGYVRAWTAWLDAASRGAARIEPYPASARCMNLLHSLWLVEADLPEQLADRLLAAVHAELAWLERHLERDVGANHLQRNLTALAWGSLALGGTAARRRERYLVELWRTFDEQVLEDGGHFERSPMYHAAALDDFLRTFALCRAAGTPVPEGTPPRLASMARALQWLSRPDGTLHLLNDAANAERPGRDGVIALARGVLEPPLPEPEGDFALPETGYFGTVDRAAGLRFVVDAGPPGPPHQPGHAHCDMLSFVLDLDHRPVVVDTGVHGYEGDPYREYVRSTRAHNTVSIGGREQHEVWATFRVARRGRPLEASVERGTAAYEFRGACRSYHWGAAVHRRHVRVDDRSLTVTDTVVGAPGSSRTSWLHLHPDFDVERTGDFEFTATAQVAEAGTDGVLRLEIEFNGFASVHELRGEREPVQGWHCPEFGRALPAVTLEARAEAGAHPSFGYRLRRP